MFSSKRIENMNKSNSDTNSYLYKEPQNKSKVLLISDPQTLKSSASLTVNIGSLSDPKEYFGLAHFCEHMLFMGGRRNTRKKRNGINL